MPTKWPRDTAEAPQTSSITWHEPCFYALKRGRAPRWHGPTNERTVWEHDKPLANDLRPTMKPVALIERAISNPTEPGQLVVDAFLGSGSALKST